MNEQPKEESLSYPHVCFTANLSCSGVSPCEDCKAVIRDYVIVPFMQACGFKGDANQAWHLLHTVWESLWPQLHKRMDQDPDLSGRFRILRVDGLEEAVNEANRIHANGRPSTADPPPPPPVPQGTTTVLPGMVPVPNGTDLSGEIKADTFEQIMQNMRATARRPAGAVDGKRVSQAEQERLRNMTAPTAASPKAAMTPAEIAAAASPVSSGEG